MTSAVQSRQSAQALPVSDPGPAVNASESNLGDSLNQPVQDSMEHHKQNPDALLFVFP